MSTFADWNNEFRIVEGVERAIVPTGLIVTTAAHQLPNGQISTDAEPGIIIDEIDTRDGYRWEAAAHQRPGGAGTRGDTHRGG